jgi:hypothetical protein
MVVGPVPSPGAFFNSLLSKGAYNATVPRTYGYSGPIGPLPPLQILWSGTQLNILWSTGTLQAAPTPTGSWTNVSGATPPSYLVTPSDAGKYYRAVQ